MSIRMETIRYHDGETDFTGILFHETTQKARRPGVLVVHGGAGLDDHARGRAKRFAKAGYVALAGDMYGNGVARNRERVMACVNELRSDRVKLCQRARAALRALAERPECDGRVAAVGYCFGGMTVLELTRSGVELTGVVSVHGSLSSPNPAQPGMVKTKLLICHGAQDPHVPMTHVMAFAEEMNRAKADWQMIVYGEAMHGFTHESGPTMPGVAYHALSDVRSAMAIKNFLAEVFTAELRPAGTS